MTSFRPFLAAVLSLCLLVLSGCGGGDSSGESASGPSQDAQTVRFVYVSWTEGIAMTHVAQTLIEDSLGYDTELTQAGGASFAFSAVASEDADVFLDAWLPTTHASRWEEYGDRLTRLGTAYDGTSAGLVVPDYVSIDHVRDLGSIRDALDGQIVGIESGAAINDQTQEVLKTHGLADDFRVVSSSGAAMTSALQRAVQNEEPIVVTGWRPHWMWGRFDLRYLDGARTGDTGVFGEPENIYKLTHRNASTSLPPDALAFLKAMHLSEDEMASLVNAFRPGVEDNRAAAEEWIRAHPDVVASWLAAE